MCGLTFPDGDNSATSIFLRGACVVLNFLYDFLSALSINVFLAASYLEFLGLFAGWAVTPPPFYPPWCGVMGWHADMLGRTRWFRSSHPSFSKHYLTTLITIGSYYLI